MNILINEQLKSLRKAKGNTQEDLAAYLGISIQAVSKWERSEGYPDITLLPSIAAYYNVSVDDLLGVGELQKQKKIEEYRKKDLCLYHDGKSEERLKLWREAEKEFPNDLSVAYQVMFAMVAVDRTKYAKDIIAYGERLINESNDTVIRSGAIQCLCFTNNEIGEVEEAKKYAKMCALYHVTVNELMPRLLDGEEAINYCQSNIQALIELVWNNVRIMVWKGNLPVDEQIKAYEFALDCFKLLYPDENYGFFNCRISEIYNRLAKLYKGINNADYMFDCLDKVAYFAVKFDTRGNENYTGLMVNRQKYTSDDDVKNHTENQSALILKELSGEVYNEFKDEKRLNAIIDRLKPIANIK